MTIIDDEEHLFIQLIYLMENLKSLRFFTYREDLMIVPRKIIAILNEELKELGINRMIGRCEHLKNTTKSLYSELAAIGDMHLTKLTLSDCHASEDSFYEILKAQRHLEELVMPEIGDKNFEPGQKELICKILSYTKFTLKKLYIHAQQFHTLRH